MKTIKVFDTTLRDGEQGIGNLMSIAQKTQIILCLDKLGLDIIELGFPAASEEDKAWFQQAAQLNLQTKVCGFSRLLMSDLQCTLEAMKDFKQCQIQLLAIGSEIHLEHKHKMTLEEAQANLAAAVTFLKNNRIEDIAIILEDSTRGSKALLKAMISTAIHHGVTTITLADTVGCATPSYIYELISWTTSNIDKNVNVGIHCHNDLGLATANTLAAIEAGTDLIQTTLGGIGERVGNCALEEVAAVLHYKKNIYQNKLNINLKNIVKAVHQTFAVLGKDIPHNKPLLSEYAFSTAAGIHQNGILKNPETYEYVRAEDVGRKQVFVKNRLSSKRNIPSWILKNIEVYVA